jgi:hypothetical protein
LPAVVTDVDLDEDRAWAVLYAGAVEGEPDPFAGGAPVSVDVAVGTATPLGVLTAGPAAIGGTSSGSAK